VLLLAIRDAVAIVAVATGKWIVHTDGGEIRLSGGLDFAVHILSIAIVFTIAPELLRRILKTRPLEAPALRQRLEHFSAATRTRFTQLLQWHTDGTASNAMVMGILPQMRYVLLSDLLLETMDDREIEAVFAHETGHVRHHHMLWYAVFLIAFMLVFALTSALMMHLMGANAVGWAMDSITLVSATVLFLVTFSALSRLFERQADAYAVRSLEAARTRAHPLSTAVTGPAVDVFCSALARVAAVNNIPIDAFNATHGSIRSRMVSLHSLAVDPANTVAFDRKLFRVKLSIVAVFFGASLLLAWLLPRLNVAIS
jgi:STE24 endopeptidase